MSTPFTVDIEAQLRGGVIAALQTLLSGLVTHEGIRSDWENADLLRALSADDGGLNPIVVVQIPQIVPAKKQPSSPQGKFMDALTPLPDGSLQRLTQVQLLSAPVMLTIGAAGLRGPDLAWAVGNRIRTAWRSAVDLPLPDCKERADLVPAGTWTAAANVFPITGRLTFTRMQPSFKDQAKEIYQCGLAYTASTPDWVLSTSPLIADVDVGVIVLRAPSPVS